MTRFLLSMAAGVILTLSFTAEPRSSAASELNQCRADLIEAETSRVRMVFGQEAAPETAE